MKKAYKKPMMIVEWFTLSQTIAQGCGDNLEDYGSPTHTRRTTCAWEFLGGAAYYFLDSNDVCLDPVEEGGSDFICYNAPEGGINLFHS
jgi:hypothetical protein